MWKLIKGFSRYEVSDTGKIRNKETGLILKPSLTKNGYLIVDLCIYGKHKISLIHRLVAMAFIPNDDVTKTQINHKNGDKSDNRIENLEWCNGSYNTQHAYANNLIKHFTKHVILESKYGIIEFESITLCAEYLQVTMNDLSQYLRKKYKNPQFKSRYKIYYKKDGDK